MFWPPPRRCWQQPAARLRCARTLAAAVRRIRVSSAEQVPGPTGVGGDGCSCTDRCTRAAATQGGSGWHDAARRARLLSWISLGYMAAEGLVALVAAVVAGSVALL